MENVVHVVFAGKMQTHIFDPTKPVILTDEQKVDLILRDIERWLKDVSKARPSIFVWANEDLIRELPDSSLKLELEKALHAAVALAVARTVRQIFDCTDSENPLTAIGVAIAKAHWFAAASATRVWQRSLKARGFDNDDLEVITRLRDIFLALQRESAPCIPSTIEDGARPEWHAFARLFGSDGLVEHFRKELARREQH